MIVRHVRDGGDAAELAQLGVDAWPVLEEFPLAVPEPDRVPDRPQHLHNTILFFVY
jgi:hypothetical protein